MRIKRIIIFISESCLYGTGVCICWYVLEIESIHSRKLIKLGVIRQDVLTNTNVASRDTRTKRKEKLTIVHYHSDRQLTDLEHKALSKGLKYGIRSKKVDEYEILSRFEELAQALDKLEVKEKGDET